LIYFDLFWSISIISIYFHLFQFISIPTLELPKHFDGAPAISIVPSCQSKNGTWWLLLPPHFCLIHSHYAGIWHIMADMKIQWWKSGKTTINQWEGRVILCAQKKEEMWAYLYTVKAFLAIFSLRILSLGLIIGWLLNNGDEKQNGADLKTINLSWCRLTVRFWTARQLWEAELVVSARWERNSMSFESPEMCHFVFSRASPHYFSFGKMIDTSRISPATLTNPLRKSHSLSSPIHIILYNVTICPFLHVMQYSTSMWLPFVVALSFWIQSQAFLHLQSVLMHISIWSWLYCSIPSVFHGIFFCPGFVYLVSWLG
jgi:hypothetical protein